MSDRGTITQLLIDSSYGRSEAFDRLMPIVYDELRRIAHRHLQRERAGHTLDTTELVHEVYLKLFDLDRIQYRNRGHFYAIAAQAMRNILVNYAQRRNAQKRGGRQQPVPLDDVVVMSEQQASQLLDLNDVLDELAELSARQSQVVECRFFAGLTVKETAEALDISTATVKRDWAAARTWLNRALGSPSHAAADSP